MTGKSTPTYRQHLPRHQRYLRLAGASLTAALLTLTACGGSSSSDAVGSDPGNNNGGGNPPDREQLSITAPAQTKLDIKTVSEQTVRYGNEARRQTVRSDIRANISLERTQDTFILNAVNELRSLTPDFTGMRNLRLFGSRTDLNERGEALRFEKQNGDIYDILALEAFSLPAFYLSVPATPVGVGDSWTVTNQLPSLTGTLTTTVEAMDADSITVKKELAIGTDSRQRFAVSTEMRGVYARPSLLMRSAEITLNIRFEDEFIINGEAQTLTEERVFTQTIREASE